MTLRYAMPAAARGQQDQDTAQSLSKTAFGAALEMEPLPQTAIHLLRLITTDAWETDDVVKLVSLDQALVAQLLRAANSLVYSVAIPVNTLKGAIQSLGAGVVTFFSIGAGIHEQMTNGTGDQSHLGEKLWKHSVAAAFAVLRMPEVINRRISPEACVAALLHDIGKTVILRYLASELAGKSSYSWKDRIMSPAEAVVTLQEEYHSVVGMVVARQWNLPRPIVNGIRFHHDPGEFADGVVDVVHVSDVIANLAGAASGGKSFDTEIADGVARRLGLTAAAKQRLCHMVEENLEEVLDLYALRVGETSHRKRSVSVGPQ